MRNSGLVVMLLLTSFVAGCVATPDAPGRSAAVFDDLPSPRDFEMIREQTYGHVYPAFRVYTQTYRGTTAVSAVAEFYKAQMPVHKWILAEANDADKEHVILNYTKGIEICAVRIDAESRDKTSVRVEVTKK